MSELSAVERPRRRQRVEARRSAAAVLDAAVRVLNQRPQANMADIAKAAGVSRQTVYAHFPSREALVSAAIDHATKGAVAAMDAADFDDGTATAALLRFADAGWQSFERYPLLLSMSGGDPKADNDRHQQIYMRLERLIERGQQTAEFDSELSAAWLANIVIALGHAAGEQVTAGRLTHQEASAALRYSMLKLVNVQR